MKKIKISIITVVYNGFNVIKETIESVLRQTYTCIEYIVIDGRSKDGTVDIINRYKTKISKIVVEADNGIYDAMNKGLSYASGDFVFFMNAGDLFITNFVIESVVAKIGNNNSVYYGNVLFVNSIEKSLSFYGGKFSKFRLCFHNICHQSIFYPRTVYTKYKYNLCYPVLADHHYNIVLKGNGIVFTYINELISFYDTTGISATKKDDLSDDKSSIIYHNLGFCYYIYYILKKNIRIRLVCQNLVNCLKKTKCKD